MVPPSLSPGPVLVACDFNEAADVAIRQAHKWATSADCDLSLLDVGQSGTPGLKEISLGSTENLTHLALGCVAEQVVRYAHCSVMVVRNTVTRFAESESVL